jgi:hypothetical protein
VVVFIVKDKVIIMDETKGDNGENGTISLIPLIKKGEIQLSQTRS